MKCDEDPKPDGNNNNEKLTQNPDPNTATVLRAIDDAHDDMTRHLLDNDDNAESVIGRLKDPNFFADMLKAKQDRLRQVVLDSPNCPRTPAELATEFSL